MCKWFIGLAFNKVENQNIDLTYDIQSFTNAGMCTCIDTRFYYFVMSFSEKIFFIMCRMGYLDIIKIILTNSQNIIPPNHHQP